MSISAKLACAAMLLLSTGAGAALPDLPESLQPMQAEAPQPRQFATRDTVTTGQPLRPVDTAWVESTLASMSLDKKIGQMIMPGYLNDSAAQSLIQVYHVGGFIFQGNNNTAPAVQSATNYLQSISPTPLLFSTDCEAGLGARFTDATRFPLNMGDASAGDLDLIRKQGAITARECRAVGIQIGFGPVLDVNTEVINPIIGIRAYSDNPTTVANLARAYVEGAHSEGLLCTFKHFPGHGAADGDSHSGLPTISIPYADILSKHVAPYTTLLGEGLGDLVMTAHVWYPALDPGTTPWPATLSYPALHGILRDQLAYDGCLISDSFGMAGLQTAATTYDAVKYSVVAGLDIVLTPPSVADTFNGIKDRVISGEIPMSRIDNAVRHILALKSRVGIPEQTTVPVTALTTVGHPDNTAVAEQLARKTVAARLATGVVPIQPAESVGVFVLGGNSTIFYSYNSSYFTSAFTLLHPNATVVNVPSSPTSTDRANLLAQSRTFNKVVIVSMEWKPTLNSSSQVTLINNMIADGRPLVYLSFGSPYQRKLFPNLQNFLCGFCSHYATQQEMAKVLVGQSQPQGSWPVQMDPPPAAVDIWSGY